MKKISLKEAGRFSNYFNELMSSIHYDLMYDDMEKSKKTKLVKLTEIKKTHKHSEALNNSSDVVKTEKNDYHLTLEELEKLYSDILSEKIRLANAIAKAKKDGLLDVKVSEGVFAFDSAIEYTKLLQIASREFYKPLLNKGDTTTREEEGSGYTFNEEGNQTKYFYPIEVEVKSFIDKSKVRDSNKKIKTLSNELSMEIDNVSAQRVIEFESTFSYLDSFEDMVNNIKK